jgi:hypothetical protein
MPAALRLVLGIKTELDERVLVLGGNQEDVAAAAAIAAAWPATRNILLAPKGQATVAAIPGLYQDASFIYKHGDRSLTVAAQYGGGSVWQCAG